MAAPDQEHPDFQAMEETMNGVGHLSLELVTNLRRMGNVPGFDGGVLILAEMRAMQQDMERRFENMELRLKAA